MPHLESLELFAEDSAFCYIAGASFGKFLPVIVATEYSFGETLT